MLPNTPSSHDSNFSEDAETKLIPSLHNHFRQRQRSVPKHTDLLPTSRTKSAGKEQVMQRFFNILVTEDTSVFIKVPILSTKNISYI